MSLPFELEPTSWSRNWDTEEVDEQEFVPPKPIAFLWKTEQSPAIPLKTNTLVVALKSAASCFVHVLFPNKQQIASIEIPEIKPPRAKTPTLNDPVCGVYSVAGVETDKLLLLVCHFDIPADRANQWTKVIFSNIAPERTIVLDTLIGWKYAQDTLSNSAPPLLRKLETDSAKTTDKEICPYLESPHLIEKATAAILTYHQIRGSKAIAFLSLEDTRRLEVETVQAFEPVLQTLQHVTLPNDALSQYHKLLNTLYSRRPNPLFL